MSDKMRNTIGLILALLCAGIAFWFERPTEGAIFLAIGILIFSIAPSDEEDKEHKVQIVNLPDDTWSR